MILPSAQYVSELREGHGRWILLHTRSRQEKQLAADLRARDLRVFLPLITRVTRRQSRKMEVQWPLFPGYVFLHGSLDDAYTADRTKRVAHIVTIADQDRVTREIQSIQQALEAGADLAPLPQFSTGARVRVRSGPLEGVEGIVEKQMHSHRLVLQIEAIGGAACLEIDPDLLETL